MTPTQCVSIIIPVYNRRDVTLACLNRLQATGVLDWAEAFVIDDGSKDGTAATIAAEHPAVHVLRGDGSLWWSGAIDLGMRTAIKRGAEIVFWLNDDCHVRAGSLALMRDHVSGTGQIAVAQTKAIAGGTLGGWKKTWRGLRPVVVPESQSQRCDTFSGNCVAIPRTVWERIGGPDRKRLPHGFGDTDFGLRAQREGFESIVLGDAICEDFYLRNTEVDSWLFGERTIRDHWKSMRSIKSYYYPPAFWTLCTRHWGAWGVVLFAQPYLKLLLSGILRTIVPRKILTALFARHSKEWRVQQRVREGNNK